MSDVVVTVPQNVWKEWLLEGDLAGQPQSGREYGFTLGGADAPPIRTGDRVYIVAYGLLRGYAPLTRLTTRPLCFWRKGRAVAVTIPAPIPGFRGWRERWWEREVEAPFPDWKTRNVK